MTAQEFLVGMLTNLEVKEVYHLRAKQVDTDTGLDMPSVIWRSVSKRRADSIDGPSSPSTEVFEIECRDKSATETPAPGEEDKSAQGLAETLLSLLGPRLVSVLADYDEPDDPSQEVSGYYSHILRVEINNVS